MSVVPLLCLLLLFLMYFLHFSVPFAWYFAFFGFSRVFSLPRMLPSYRQCGHSNKKYRVPLISSPCKDKEFVCGKHTQVILYSRYALIQLHSQNIFR